MNTATNEAVALLKELIAIPSKPQQPTKLPISSGKKF